MPAKSLVVEGLRKSPSPKRTQDTFGFYGLVLLALCFAIVTLLGPSLAPYDPAAQDLKERLSAPTSAHLLGTDEFGRDSLSRLLSAARTSITVSLSTILIAGGLGVFWGVLAAYRGGVLDELVRITADALMAFPSLLLGLLVLAVLGSGLVNVVIAASLALLPRFIRLSRNLAASVSQKEFVVGARAAGATDLRITMIHIWPNIQDEIMTSALLWIAQVIRMEAGLSFLGVGIQPPQASLGLMIKQGFAYLHVSPWPAIISGMFIVAFILVLTLLSDQIVNRRTTDRHV